MYQISSNPSQLAKIDQDPSKVLIDIDEVLNFLASKTIDTHYCKDIEIIYLSDPKTVHINYTGPHYVKEYDCYVNKYQTEIYDALDFHQQFSHPVNNIGHLYDAMGIKALKKYLKAAPEYGVQDIVMDSHTADVLKIKDAIYLKDEVHEQRM